MKKTFYFHVLLVGIILSVLGCTESLHEQEKYQPPEWLKGKLFSQIEDQENLQTFIQGLKRSGYDTLLNTSGSYTVFAPTDNAFEQFFQDHPTYDSIGDMPKEEVIDLVEYQIIFNAWSKKQFRLLDVQGWIDPESEYYDEPRGYKRQTLLKQENESYPVEYGGETYRITDESNQKMTVYVRSKKYVPIFYKEYFNIYDLKGSDYGYYFNRPLNDGKLYYAGAEIQGNEIPAENGFIYKTDKVVSPLPTAEEILRRGSEGRSYDKFLNLIYQFSELYYNQEATYEGLEVGEVAKDSLYNVRYPDLVFNIQSELTGNINLPRFTIRAHHGLLAPSDQVFENFVEEYIEPGWGDFENMPIEIKEILVNSHMSENAVYETDINKGFINGSKDSVLLDKIKANIVQKSYGSNCSFLGLDKVIIPRAFKSVCRPVYLTQKYETMMYAIEKTKVLPA